MMRLPFTLFSVTLWLSLGVSLPQQERTGPVKDSSQGTVPEEPNQSLRDPSGSVVKADLGVAGTALAALGAAWTISVPIIDYFSKKRGNPHGRALIEIERLKEFIPKSHPKHWCMRICMYSEMFEAHYHGRVTKDIFERTFEKCGAKDNCNLKDPLYVHFPVRMSKTEVEGKPGDPKTIDVQAQQFSDLAGATKDSFFGAMQKGLGPNVGGGIGGRRDKPLFRSKFHASP